MLSLKPRRFAVLLAFLLILPDAAVAGGGPLSGSRSSQIKQNKVANRHDLTRLKDLKQLRAFIADGLLVAVGDTDAYVIDKSLGEMDPDHADLYAHARPWVKAFLGDVLGECRASTGARFTITSLVRTKAYQKKLRRHNHAAASGKTWWKQSSHLTGSTVDISYLDLDDDAERCLEKKLRALEKKGLIEATKEYGNACFHVMVFPEYAKPATKAVKKKKTRKAKKPRSR
jgi:hypothetical protein